MNTPSLGQSYPSGVDPGQWGGYTYAPGNADGEQQDLNRYQNLASTPSAPTQMNTAQADGSRVYQVNGLASTGDAMNLDQQAAMGNAPSAAVALGQQQTDSSINSQMAMAASARGGPTAIAGAQRAAAFQGAQTQAANTSGLMAQRASEMSDARNQYLGAASAYGNQADTLHGQDLGQASTQAGLDDASTARNQQNQFNYNQLGYQTENAAQQNAISRAGTMANTQVANRAASTKSSEDAWGHAQDVVGGIAGVAGSLLSDERTKEPVYATPQAPGSDDWNHTGGDTSHRAVDWSHGGSLAPAAPSAGMQFLRGVTQGMSKFAAHPQTAAYQPIRSDERAKYPVAGLGGGVDLSASGGHIGLNASTGLGSPQPIHGMVGGGGIFGGTMPESEGGVTSGPIRSDANSKYIYSDERAKRSAYLAGRADGSSSQTEGAQAPFRYDPPAADEEMFAAPGGQPELVLKESSSRRPADRQMQSFTRDPVASANRAQEASAYTYKPEFAASSGQSPGEVNVGPMAQTMASDPVAATAVKRGDDGYLMLDSPKLQKLHSAGIASLQRQIDEMRNMTYRGAAR